MTFSLFGSGNLASGSGSSSYCSYSSKTYLLSFSQQQICQGSELADTTPYTQALADRPVASLDSPKPNMNNPILVTDTACSASPESSTEALTRTLR